MTSKWECRNIESARHFVLLIIGHKPCVEHLRPGVSTSKCNHNVVPGFWIYGHGRKSKPHHIYM